MTMMMMMILQTAHETSSSGVKSTWHNWLLQQLWSAAEADFVQHDFYCCCHWWRGRVIEWQWLLQAQCHVIRRRQQPAIGSVFLWRRRSSTLCRAHLWKSQVWQETDQLTYRLTAHVVNWAMCMTVLYISRVLKHTKPVVKVVRSSRGAQGTEMSMRVGNLAHFMHKITLFH